MWRGRGEKSIQTERLKSKKKKEKKGYATKLSKIKIERTENSKKTFINITVRMLFLYLAES